MKALTKIVVFLIVIAIFGSLGISALSDSKVSESLVTGDLTSHKLIAGKDTSFYIDANYILWSFGKNDVGQLGDGTRINRDKPVRIMDEVDQVYSFSTMTLAIKLDGSLWAWGFNGLSFGDGTHYESDFPVKIDENVMDIAAGDTYAMILKTNGDLYSWGANEYGQLGLGNTSNTNTKKLVLSGVVSVASGMTHSLAIKNDGSLWAWGDNRYGQLGNGHTENVKSPIKITDHAKDIAANGYFTALIKDDNSLWMWGRNDSGQLGSGNRLDSSIPINIQNNVLMVSLGERSSYSLTQDLKMWGWGNNDYSQLGNNSKISTTSPIVIMSDIMRFDAGNTHVIAQKSNLDILAWGSSTYGQLGNGFSLDNREFNPIYTNTIDLVLSTSSILVKSDNSLWSWGYNERNNLGFLTSDLMTVIPTKILENVKSVTRNFAIKTDNSLWSWGMTDSYGVLPVKFMDDAKEVTRGYFQYSVVKNDATLWVWDGAMGGGLDATQLMTNVKMVAAGEYHYMVLKDDGTLWVKGGNSRGQLGLGNRSWQSSFVQVMSGVEKISASSYESFALKTDGTLWSWGGNNAGLSASDVLTPTKLLSGVKDISSAQQHSLALTQNGDIWSWGSNWYGELGSSSAQTFEYTPIFVGNYQGVKKIRADLFNSEIILENGTVYACGDNSYNQLSLWQFSVTNPTVVMEKGVAYDYASVKIVSGAKDAFVFSSNSLLLSEDNTLWYLNQKSQIIDSNVIDYASYDAEFIVKEDGSLWVSGNNYSGQLGIGKISSYEPKQKTLSNVKHIAVWGHQTFAILNNGDLLAWGGNESGILGNGNTTIQPSPVLILKDVVDISIGSFSIYALKSDGTLWGWGYNLRGQLLNADYLQLVPFKIADNVISVASGENNVFYITNENKLFGLGNNQNGVLGIGNTTDQYTPVEIMNNVKKVFASSYSTFAITVDDDLYAWGSNQFGTLGDGTTTTRLTPTMILDHTSIVASDAYSTTAIRTDGRIFVWGNNGYGQFGGKSPESSLIPIQINPFTTDIYKKFEIDSNTSTLNIPISNFRNVLSYRQDLEAKFEIIYQSIENNAVIDIYNNIKASQPGVALLRITNKEGTILYNQVQLNFYEGVQINGIINYSKFNHNVEISTLNSVNVLIDGSPMVSNYIETEGTHQVEMIDQFGLEYSVSFLIDKTAPVITVTISDENPTINNVVVSATTNEGSLNVSEYTFTDNGIFSFIAVDQCGNKTIKTVVVSNIDRIPPVISGVASNGIYNTAREITFTEGNVTLDGQTITSGTTIAEEGIHEIVAVDDLGNTDSFTFTLDFTPPTIKINNYNLNPTNQDVLVTAFATGGVLNQVAHLFTQNGSFEFVAIDLAGNETRVLVTITNIDKDAPVIVGVTDNTYYKQDRTIQFDEGTVLLNDVEISSGFVVSTEGTYHIVATDSLGNRRELVFYIDKTAPVISGLLDTTYFIETPVISFTEGSAKLDGQEFKSGSKVNTPGSHTLVLTDLAGNSSEEKFTVIPYLSTPVNLTSDKISFDSVTINWSSVDYATGYEIYRSQTLNGIYTKVGSTQTLKYADSLLNFNSQYYYKVRAYVVIENSTYFSEYSSVISAKTSLNGLSNVLISNISYNSYNLGWDAVPGATGYEIYRSIGTSTTYTLLKSVTTTSTTDTLLVTNTKYNYKVRAYRIANLVKVYGAFSPVVSATPLPSAPVVSLSSTGYNSIKITWPVVTGANGYEVSYSTSENGTYTKLALLTTNSASISALITSQTYFVKVRAYRIVNYVKIFGPYSSITSAAPIPSTPVVTATSLGFDTLKLSWGAISGATGYELYKLNPLTSSYDLLQDTALLTYTDSGLVTGKDIFYKVKAYRLVGTTKVYSLDSSVITSKALPSTVTGLKTLLPKYTELSVTWTAVPGATGYEISRSATLAGAYTVLGNVEGVTTYTNTGLTFNTTYYYKVRAYTTVNDIKVYGSVAVAVSGKTALETVLNPSAAYTSYNSNLINWTAVNGATGYEIYRSTGTSTTYALLTSTTALSYTNTALLTNTRYNYKIRAYRLVGTVKVYGPFSSVVSSTPLPWAPTATVSSSGYNSLKVTWPAVTGANGYEVSYSTSETGTYTKLALVTTNSASIANLLTNSTYYVKVRAYRIVNYVKVFGASSVVVSGKPIPATPVMTLVSAGYDSAKITWAAIPGATGYELYVVNPVTRNYDLISDTALLTYTHTGLVTGQLSEYMIKAYRLVGDVRVYSPQSQIKSVTPVPALVTGFKVAMPSVASLKLAWTPVAGASGYELFKATTLTGTYVSLGIVEGKSEFTVTGLTFNTTTYYKVRAYTTVNDVKVNGDSTVALSAKTAPSPVVLSVVNTAYNANTLSWPAVEGANGYEIYSSSGTSTYYTLLKTLTTTSFTHSALVYNTQYNYKVRAYKLVGTTKVYGAYSPLISMVTKVSAPVVESSVTPDSITLSWAAVSGASGYEVSMATAIDGVYTSVLQTALSKTYPGLTLGNTYYFKVRAYRLVGTTKIYGVYSDVLGSVPTQAVQ